jgi:hypothetical protein
VCGVAHSSRLEEAETKFKGPVSGALRATGKHVNVASAIPGLGFGNETEIRACLERASVCCVCVSVTTDASRATREPSNLLASVFIACSTQIAGEDTKVRIGHDIVFHSWEV